MYCKEFVNLIKNLQRGSLDRLPEPKHDGIKPSDQPRFLELISISLWVQGFQPPNALKGGQIWYSPCRVLIEPAGRRECERDERSGKALYLIVQSCDFASS